MSDEQCACCTCTGREHGDFGMCFIEHHHGCNGSHGKRVPCNRLANVSEIPTGSVDGSRPDSTAEVVETALALVGEAWDDGNGSGLDGWVGPGRGAGEVDAEAQHARTRMVHKADRLLSALAAAGLLAPSDTFASTKPSDAELTEVERLRAEVADLRENPRDDYHSMSELYDYRMLYNAHAAHGWFAAGIPVVKSWRHSDGEECFGGGWFIVTATLPAGQVSNHYKAEHWDLFRIPEALPPAYDGHTPTDAAERLRAPLPDADVAERIARALEEAAEKHPNPIVRLNLSDAADIARSHAAQPAIGTGTVNGLDVRDWQQIAASKDEAVEAAVGALNRVRELHKPVDIEPSGTVCGVCSFRLPYGRYFGKIVDWPCATIQALDATPPVPAPEAVSGYTSHGHRITGVVQTGRPASVARCGGPGLCTVCSLEAGMATNERHER